MTPALLVAIATFALVCGAALMAWPAEVDGPAAAPALYRRRILGAMIVGASLFLGGFTLAWELAA